MAAFGNSSMGGLELDAGPGASLGLSAAAAKGIPGEPPGKPSKGRTTLDQLSEWQDISLMLADALRRHEVTDCLMFRKLFDGSHEEAGNLACELGCGSEVVGRAGDALGIISFCCANSSSAHVTFQHIFRVGFTSEGGASFKA